MAAATCQTPAIVPFNSSAAAAGCFSSVAAHQPLLKSYFSASNPSSLASSASSSPAETTPVGSMRMRAEEYASTSSQSSKTSASPSQPYVTSSKPSVELLALASSFPDTNYPTKQLLDAFLTNYYHDELPEEERLFVENIFEKTRIKTSHVSLPPEQLFSRLTLPEYTKHIKASLESLALKAAEQCFIQLATQTFGNTNEDSIHAAKQSITHLVFGTMTGSIAAPSMDIQLALALNLSPYTKRLNVESMGCLTGFRLIGLCRDLVMQDPTNNRALLIVCDIRSALGNTLRTAQKDSFSRTDVIVSALFRDGGGAAVFGAPHQYSGAGLPQQALTTPSSARVRLSVVEHLSYLIPNSIDHAWVKQEDDGAQQLYLSKDLPDCIRKNLPSILLPLLSKQNVKVESCLFAVHTGGPRVIFGVQQALNLVDEQLAASWWVMIYKGNLSGSSNLIVVEHWMRFLNNEWVPSSSDSNKIDNVEFPSNLTKYTHMVGVSFGPGVGVELVLFAIQRPSS